MVILRIQNGCDGTKCYEMSTETLTSIKNIVMSNGIKKAWDWMQPRIGVGKPILKVNKNPDLNLDWEDPKGSVGYWKV